MWCKILIQNLLCKIRQEQEKVSANKKVKKLSKVGE